MPCLGGWSLVPPTSAGPGPIVISRVPVRRSWMEAGAGGGSRTHAKGGVIAGLHTIWRLFESREGCGPSGRGHGVTDKVTLARLSQLSQVVDQREVDADVTSFQPLSSLARRLLG